MLETSQLFQYPQSCTFALIHEDTKTVVLYDTINFFKTLGEILNKLQNNQYDYPSLYEARNNLIIKVISENQNLDTRRQMFSHEIETFKNKGYTVLNRKQKLLKYTIRTVLTRYKNKSVVAVVKVTTRNEKHIMGVFNNMVEANEFIKLINNTKVIPDITASNDLTKSILNTDLNIPLRL